MAMLAFAAALALDLPRTLGQAEAPQPQPQNLAAQQGASNNVFEFGRVQASVRAGIVAYSDDFEADAEFMAGLAARVDWPWMSRDVFGFAEDRIGLYLDVSFTKIDRDLDFLDDNSGNVILVGFGADINIYEDETCVFRGQAGVQYGNFGGVEDTDDGFAGVLGLEVGVKLAENMAIVLNPQIAFGNAGDQLYFLTLGFQYRF